MGPDLVGRSGELAMLADAARAVARGAGRCIHVVGEAGIGKTCLLSAAAGALAREGVETRSGAADETDHRRTLGLVRTLLPEALAAEAGPRDLADPLAGAIDALERLAAAGPVALLADDVHWADDASLDVLGAVARRAEPLGVLLVTAARPRPAPTGLRRLEATLQGCGALLAPEPLAAPELAALVEERLGAPPGQALTDLLAGTAGNPFLAVELVASLADERRLVVEDGRVELTLTGSAGADTGAGRLGPSGAGPGAGAGMPDDLVERLARHTLAAVPAGELVLRATAAIPGGLTVEELAALVDQPLGEIVAVVLAAVDAAVLVDTGSTLVFRHDMLRQAIVRSSPPSVVRALQRQAATVLVARQAEAERVAACLLAREPPLEPPLDPPLDATETAQLLAVGRSMERRNPRAAADLLCRALDGIRRDDPRSLPTTIEAGWALIAAGRAREVGPLVHDRSSSSSGSDVAEPLPIELVRLESVALSLTGRLGEASARYDRLDPARMVEDLDQRDPDPDVLDAAAELAFLRLTAGRLDEAARLVDWIERSSAPATVLRRATVSTVRAWLAGTEGAFEAGIEHARTALGAMVDNDNLAVTAASPTLALGMGLDNMGDSDGALAVFRQVGGNDVVGGIARSAPPLLQFGAALALFRRGEWDDALAEAEAGLLAAEETGLGLGAFWPCSVGALVRCAQGDIAGARSWLDRSQAVTLRHPLGLEWLLNASAAVHEAEGNVEQAATILDTLTRAVIDAGAPALLLNAATDMVRLAQATGRTGSAARVVHELGAMADRTASPVVRAIARWARGLAASAPSDVEAAADLLARHGRVPEAARARHDAAVLAVADGRVDDARRLALQAFSVYDQLGADQLHRRLRSELRAHGVVMRPRRSAPRPSHGWDSLTASESGVLDLVAQGLTNTQIAEQLYISRRTVESHLGRIYTKLDIATRAQLVATAGRRAAGHPPADDP